MRKARDPRGPGEGTRLSKTDRRVSGRGAQLGARQNHQLLGDGGRHADTRCQGLQFNRTLTISRFFGGDGVRKTTRRGHCYFKAEKCRA